MVGTTTIKAGPGIFVKQRGSNFIISASASGGSGIGGGENRWVSWGSAEDVTADQITTTSSEALDPGTPIRWHNGTSYDYAIVVSGSASIYMYIGPPITEGASLFYDRYSMTTTLHMTAPGSYGESTYDNVIWSIGGTRFAWLGSPAFIVGWRIMHVQDATTTQPKMNVGVNDDLISATSKACSASSWTTNSTTDILTTYYEVAYGDNIRVAVTDAGVGATHAEDLSVEILLVAK